MKPIRSLIRPYSSSAVDALQLFAAAAVLSLTILGGSWTRAENQRANTAKEHQADYLAVMRMLEANLQANYEKIRTWTGTLELQQKVPVDSFLMPKIDAEGKVTAVQMDGRFLVESKCLVRFSLNIPENQLASSYCVVGVTTYTNLDTNEVYEAPHTTGLSDEHHVLTAEHWLKSLRHPESNDEDMRLREGKHLATRRPPKDSRYVIDYATLIDPRRFMGHGATPFWRIIRSTADWLEKGHTTPLEIIELPSTGGASYRLIEEYRTNGPESAEKPTVVEHVYSESVGFNPVSSKEVLPSGATLKEVAWEYMVVSGIHIPKKYHLRIFKKNSDAICMDRIYSLTETEVNVPLDERTFTWDSLGLVEADQIDDKIQDKQFRVQNGHFVPADQYVNRFLKPTAPSAGSRRLQLMFAALSVLLIVCVIVTWAYRRRWR